jgi:hypothetical protein
MNHAAKRKSMHPDPRVGNRKIVNFSEQQRQKY